jgi:hypothetical protein
METLFADGLTVKQDCFLSLALLLLKNLSSQFNRLSSPRRNPKNFIALFYRQLRFTLSCQGSR